MKKHLSLILVLLPVLFLALPALAQERKKVGVVLSGGGAKGVAHIQALKVIEEAGIPIDYIVGTSMGSIIGGLYSIGYTPQQLDSMVRKQDWMFLLSDRVKRSAMSLNEREKSEKYVFSFPFTKSPKDAVSGGIIKGQNLANLYGTDSGISRFRRFQQTSHPLCLRFTKYRKWRTDCVPQWNTCHSYAGQYGYSGSIHPGTEG